MRFIAVAVLPMLMALASCSSTDYDLVETSSVSPSVSSVKPKFDDTDPQDFGRITPHHHHIHGIDVSKWNGDIDWMTVKNSGVSFAFIKATEGKDRLDDRFHENWQEARAARMPYAPYHFYYFCSTADDQADWFIRNVPRSAVYLPPVLDVEWNGASKTCKYRPSKATAVYELKKFMDRLEKHYGKRPIIYTAVDFHRDILVGEFNDYHYWLRAVADHPSKVYDRERWAFWQYTSTGQIPGIKGDTDINVFAGSRKNWQNWVKSAAAGS